MKIKSILVSQVESTPYQQMIEKYKLKIDFKSFIEFENVTGKGLRTQKIDLNQYTAIILTSRMAVDHFFRVAEEMRFKVPDTMKYFCQSEAVALYLQKYITYRKRKTYIGKRDFTDLIAVIKKHKEEKYLFPTSDTLKAEFENALNDLKINWKRGIFYKSVYANLSDIKRRKYDAVVFFNPAGIEAFFHNFPNFEQGNVRIATFGKATLKEAENRGLKVEIQAPVQEAPSMTLALEKYLEVSNKRK